MKAPEIADRLVRSLAKDATHHERTLLKLQALCRRMGVESADVLVLLPDDVLAIVKVSA